MASDTRSNSTAASPESGVETAPSSVERSQNVAEHGKPPEVLLVDDDAQVLRSLARKLAARGCSISTARDGADAVAQLVDHNFDVILSDIRMPGMDGIQLLREVRGRDLHLPVVLMTGDPSLQTARDALELGALMYLSKPLDLNEVEAAIKRATHLHRLAHIKTEAAEFLGGSSASETDRAGLEIQFERTLQQLWIAYQPIVHSRSGSIFGYEALMRSTERSLPHPGAILDAAERLNRLDTLGRRIRQLAGIPLVDAPPEATLFVNLHSADLLDETLFSQDAPLTQLASRVILEITERASLDNVPDARERVGALRELGFRIAIDDMGAGYAGLTSFALLEPDIVKLDMSLVRDVDKSQMKYKLINSMNKLAHDMGILVVAEGVETLGERETLIALECDFLQGYLLARPGPPFPEISW